MQSIDGIKYETCKAEPEDAFLKEYLSRNDLIRIEKDGKHIFLSVQKDSTKEHIEQSVKMMYEIG